jgi:hypothetical protein
LEKGKEEKKIKIEKGPGGTDSAQSRNEPAAQEATPNRYTLFSLPLADRWDPPVISNLWPKSTPTTVSSP